MIFLTKTTYLNARQCHKRFWLERFAPARVDVRSEMQNLAIRQGQEVGEMARYRFPGGILIWGNGEEAVYQTKRALTVGAPTIFEATFVHDGILVRCDILERQADGRWVLIEVKSGTRIKAHYLHDLAIQAYVLAAAGVPLARLEIMHINSKQCRYPDLSALFCRVDVTERVEHLVGDLPDTVGEVRALLAQEVEPDIPIGSRCKSPHPCPLQGYCWAHVPATSIFTIARLAPQLQEKLVAQGIFDLRDIPAEFPLTARQRAYVEFVRADKPRIDRSGIRKALAKLRFPLYFFDFETYSPAVPCFDGMGPYQRVPFQYSCHVLHADGRLEHREYLHEDADDPRAPLARRLVEDLGEGGTIVAYFAQFERGVLQELAEAVPAAGAALRAMLPRLWDQLGLIRKYYDHPRFLNSKSIKRVLPVLVPELAYDDLNVQRGDEAQVVWRRMLTEADVARRAGLAADLRAYCGRDTYAMVAIHRVLTQIIQSDEEQ